MPARPFSRHNPCSDRRESRASSPIAAEFTGETDSPLEESGFEPPVPLAKDWSFRRDRKCRRGDKGSLESVVYLTGTEGSNLSPSSERAQMLQRF